ncbi:MAG: hypothetical protein HC869_19555 [Rhodospirillales bacterium]|nr:hypothetical protein [Rhodospirillales bacterium]
MAKRRTGIVSIDEISKSIALLDPIGDKIGSLAEHARQAMMIAHDPMEDLRAALAVNENTFRDTLMAAHGIGADFDQIHAIAQAHILPQLNELRAVGALLEQDAAHEALQQFQMTHNNLQHIMESMREPWLDVQDIVGSFSGFTELAGMGHALASFAPYSDHLSSIFRHELGSWDDIIVPAFEQLQDSSFRIEFYLEGGFNPALTAFPNPAFQESLDKTGIRSRLPETDDDESHATELFKLLRRIERQLRKFIAAEMTRACSQAWLKQRVPPDVLNAMRKRQEDDRASGRPSQALVEYADFGDYIQIILRNDNWRDVFQTYFSSQIDIQTSLIRLNIIRRSVMHARDVTHEDLLLAWAEGQRILLRSFFEAPSVAYIADC